MKLLREYIKELLKEDAALWKMQNEVKTLQDKLNKLENEIAAARLNKEEKITWTQ